MICYALLCAVLFREKKSRTFQEIKGIPKNAWAPRSSRALLYDLGRASVGQFGTIFNVSCSSSLVGWSWARHGSVLNSQGNLKFLVAKCFTTLKKHLTTIPCSTYALWSGKEAREIWPGMRAWIFLLFSRKHSEQLRTNQRIDTKT